jgi:large subunit ribosomal protein L3
MTHAFVVDFNKNSLTAGQEIQVPVTVLEVPPMKVAAVRVYESSRYGLKTAGEVWASGSTRPCPETSDPKNQE